MRSSASTNRVHRILGDFTHNARSALDHLADALVRANGGTPTTQTQFPICVSPFEWPGQVRRLKGASERHVSMIQAMQPYNRRDRYGWHTVWEAMGDPLAIVNRLSNVDKHRVLNATPAVVTGVTWDVKPVQDIGWVQKNMVEISDKSLEDGDVMLRFDVQASGPNPELYLERTDTVEIRIEHRVDLEGTRYAIVGGSLKDALKNIVGDLGNTFKIFVGEFR